MAPTVLSSVASLVGTANTSHTVSMPSGTVSGNGLLAFFAYPSVSTLVNGLAAGWAMLFDTNELGGTDKSLAVFYKDADGSEGADEVFTTSGSVRSVHMVHRISGHLPFSIQIPEYVLANAVNSNPDSAELTPTGGEKGYLWFSGVSWAPAGNVVTFPSGYTGTESTTTGISSSSAFRQVLAAAENPGAWEVSNPTTADWIAATLAIYPAIAAAGRRFQRASVLGV